MQYEILSAKPTMSVKSNRDGGAVVEMKDLLSPTFNADMMPENIDPIIVNEHYVARPDLISLAVYGNDKYGDMICKLNGISNPFEMNEDDILLLPTIDYLTEYVDRPLGPSELLKSAKDRLSMMEKKNAKQIDSVRSPNEKTTMDQNYVIDRSLNLVFY